ncbi:MAG TPA: molybdopterin biosynthesis protein [Anaerolineales bacterium]|nr:molybdopterin biosynthesis protein [Anaerolineales bacterium]
MSIYLHDIPLPEAKQRLKEALTSAHLWQRLGVEEIPVDEQAIGRVLAEAVWAKISSPHYHASAMDGFAVRSAHTSSAGPATPVALYYSSQTVYVDTGDPLPEWADGVIPIENVEPLDEGDLPAADARRPKAIRIRAAIPPWSHVRPVGEDIVATQLVLPEGHRVRPVDLGAVAASGHTSMRVARPPRVAILPTGSELVPIGSPVKAGDIIEYNSLVLAAQINSWGAQATRFPITPDAFDAIREKVREAAQTHDLVLLNAGSSAGAEDFSAGVIASLGEVFVHGVAVRPGHPVILGMIHQDDRSVPVVGVPGYPVSAALTAEIFVAELIAQWLGTTVLDAQSVQARLTRKVTSPPGDDDYVRVLVGRVGEQMLAAPLSRGAGVITSLVRADGLLVLPRGTQGLPAGAQVEVQLYRSPVELERTIFAIGSHDIALDLLAQYLAGKQRRLISANAGSLGGLLALQRGEAHLAGSHLLDPESGQYNLPDIQRVLPGVAVKVVTLVGRQQGLMVAKGNPKQIQSLKDLAQAEVRYINRQRGAGTRVLLDYHLRKMGIETQNISGYAVEEYTHLGVAVAIASGRADCGLGIAAAAQALSLDFIPLYLERYDLVVPELYFASPLLSPLWDTLQLPDFRQAVAAMPGYSVEQMGDLVAEVGV